MYDKVLNQQIAPKKHLFSLRKQKSEALEIQTMEGTNGKPNREKD